MGCMLHISFKDQCTVGALSLGRIAAPEAQIA